MTRIISIEHLTHITRVTDALFKENKKVGTRCKRAPDEGSAEMSLNDYQQISRTALRTHETRRRRFV